jgi:small subunit ribosomal protein S18
LDLFPNQKHSIKIFMAKFTQNRRPRRSKAKPKTPKKDPILIDGQRPHPLHIDYKDLDLLSKLTNRHGRIVGRRKSGCGAVSQHAVSQAIKRARFMALLPYTGD